MHTTFARTAFVLITILLAKNYAHAVTITGNTGPGGFEATNAASDLLYWLRADQGLLTSGSNVTDWQDQRTITPHNFSQATVSLQPVTGSGINGRPTVQFDGVDDRLTMTTSTQPLSFVAVTRLVSESQNYGGLVGPNDLAGGVRRDNLGSNIYRHNNGDSNDFTGPIASGSFFINGAATNSVNSDVNHITSAIRTAAAPTWAATSIGGYEPVGDPRQYKGHYGDLVGYSRTINSVERSLVENNFSSNYDVGITGDRYVGDSGANGDYDRDVFGVGNDGSTVRTSSGAAGFGVESPAIVSGEWLLAGHKQAANSLVTVEQNANIDSGQRWSRVWYVDVTTVGLVDATLAFDFSDGGLGAPSGSDQLSLLYSTSQTFDWNVLGVFPTNPIGDMVTFSGLDLQDGYYTLGVNVPEPSTFALLGLGALGLAVRHRRWRSKTAQ